MKSTEKNNRKKQRAEKKRPEKKCRTWVSALKWVSAFFTAVLLLLYVFSAFSGKTSPLESTGMAYLGMAYPVLLILSVVAVLVWLVCKKYVFALIFALPLLVTCDSVLTFSPVNFPFRFGREQGEFTVLSFNVMELRDFENGSTTAHLRKNGEAVNTPNKTLDYILSENADIVCLQELNYDFENEKLNLYKFTPEQYARLKEQYPYRWKGKRDLVLFSKFPVKKMRTISTNSKYGCDLYELDVNGSAVTVVNVHLKSIGLSTTDKELYMQVTELSNANENIDSAKSKIRDIRHQLLSKLGAAFVERARQAHRIRNVIDTVEGPLILCGDFNDTPGSYAYRTILNGMKDAYRECAFGPTITYHDNRFYFRIDHIFFGGGIEALDVSRGSTGVSDHYPLKATFINRETQNKQL